MDLNRLNETDIREEILAPLIRELGYRSNSRHNVLRELTLRYPLSFLGRKNQKKDQTLRGKADYVLEVDSEIRWVIEAKAPSEPISQDDVEQAYTYAIHAEVRAVYFVLCNGREFVVFQTNRSPDSDPILHLTYDQLVSAEGQAVLENLLSPLAILRDFPRQSVDNGVPLGPGLRSISRISGGYIEYDTHSSIDPLLSEMNISIIGGSIQRAADGSLISLIESRAPFRTIEEFLKRNKLTVIEVRSTDKSLSTSFAKPTVFTCSTGTIFKSGEKLFNPTSSQEVIVPFDIPVEIQFRAEVVLSGGTIEGTVYLHSKMNGQFLMEATGRTKIYLS